MLWEAYLRPSEKQEWRHKDQLQLAGKLRRALYSTVNTTQGVSRCGRGGYSLTSPFHLRSHHEDKTIGVVNRRMPWDLTPHALAVDSI